LISHTSLLGKCTADIKLLLPSDSLSFVHESARVYSSIVLDVLSFPLSFYHATPLYALIWKYYKEERFLFTEKSWHMTNIQAKINTQLMP
jgi:hypothetical protein